VPTDAVGRTASAAPAAIFGAAVAEIQDSVRVPILLPATLPAFLRQPWVNVARGSLSPDGYGVELRDSTVGGNAGNAAYFAGSSRLEDFSADLADDPDMRQLQLANGITAVFSPVSCGGSCSGPNLWWVQGGTQYSVQIHLPSDTPEAEQERIVLAAANAMVPVRHVVPGLLRQ
jgi:hypothetical protein